MGISVNDSKLAQLSQLISGWPGLVGGRPEPLIEDCLVLVDHLGDARTLIDVGSGGGLPGLPLKIAVPELEVILLEADQAKAAFLLQACARLGLEGVDVVAMRAEEAGHDARYRERFDLAVARALAPMPALVELCLPLVRIGGRLLAQKTDREDVSAAARAIDTMGGSLRGVVPARSGIREAGTVVIVDKLLPTPAMYPRRPGVPARKPI